jgi:hypothetical protein
VLKGSESEWGLTKYSISLENYLKVLLREANEERTGKLRIQATVPQIPKRI